MQTDLFFGFRCVAPCWSWQKAAEVRQTALYCPIRGHPKLRGTSLLSYLNTNAAGSSFFLKIWKRGGFFTQNVVSTTDFENTNTNKKPQSCYRMTKRRNKGRTISFFYLINQWGFSDIALYNSFRVVLYNKRKFKLGKKRKKLKTLYWQ